MKAIVYYNYGSPDVLQCQEVEQPPVGDNDAVAADDDRTDACAVGPLLSTRVLLKLNWS